MKVNMQKNKFIKQTKGITLIALVITIIVLLILAGISISMLTGDNGLLTKASTAKNKTAEAEAKEVVQIEAMGSTDERENFNYNDFKTNVKKNLGVEDKDIKDNGDGTCTVTYKGYDVTVDTTTGAVTAVEGTSGKYNTGKTVEKAIEQDLPYKKSTTIKDSDKKEITVPAGFKIIKDNPTDPTPKVSDGIVIQDATGTETNGDEFVWIPVQTAVANAEEDGTTNKAMAVNLGTEKSPQYRGLLYDFNDTGSEVISGCTTTANKYREPDILSTYDSDEKPHLNEIGLTKAKFVEEMQDNYNNMIKSVSINKGFYVSRYEMSLEETTKKAQSKKNKDSATEASKSANKWYGLYDKAKNYALKEDSTKSVVSSMIWGSQYDAMMNWMHQDSSINVNNKTPKTGTDKNTTRVTGSKEEDCLKNIYDLLGNSYESTLEASSSKFRVNRGETVLGDRTPANRYGGSPDFPDGLFSTRIALYVK